MKIDTKAGRQNSRCLMVLGPTVYYLHEDSRHARSVFELKSAETIVEDSKKLP